MNTKHKILFINILLTLVLAAGLLGGTGFTAQAGSTAPQASYIVQGLNQAALTSLVTRFGGVVTSHLEIINGVAARLPAGAAQQLAAQPGVTAVSPNSRLAVSDSNPVSSKDIKDVPATAYPSLTGATVAWEAGINGLEGEQIPLAARIFAVIDVWDALCSDRPYREAWPEERVLRHIQDESGKHFDPSIVQAFLALVVTRKFQPQPN